MLAAAKRFRPAWDRLRRRRGLQRCPGLTLHDLMLLPIERCREFFAQPASAGAAGRGDRSAAHRDPRAASTTCADVGLGYLTLDRQSRTLSGGEVQRINLTTALGTSLVNTLFVLDEPSIGLHPRDMGRVIGVHEAPARRRQLAASWSSTIRRSCSRPTACSTWARARASAAARWCSSAHRADARCACRALAHRRVSRGRAGASDRRGRDAEPRADRRRVRGSTSWAPPSTTSRTSTSRIPLNRLVCVTGVSRLGQVHAGAGRAVPGAAASQRQAHRSARRAPRARGHELIDDVVLVDQSPIGRTTRSNPASYVGAFDAIRKLFAAEPLAHERGYTAGTFSFNSGNGRCPTCGGNGFEHVEMQFLSDVYLRCPDCDGRRYRAEVLEVTSTARRAARQVHRRRAGHDGDRGASRSSRTQPDVCAPAAAGRRGPRLPAARPAGARRCRAARRSG